MFYHHYPEDNYPTDYAPTVLIQCLLWNENFQPFNMIALNQLFCLSVSNIFKRTLLLLSHFSTNLAFLNLLGI